MTKGITATQKDFDRICELVALGIKWKDICKIVKRDYSTIMRWSRRTTSFARDLARARADSAHTFIEHIREIESRVVAPRFYYETDAAGRVVLDQRGKAIRRPNPEFVEAAAGSVVIRSIQWRMSKLNRQEYGEHRDVHLSGQLDVVPVVETAPGWLQAAIKDGANVVELDPSQVEDVTGDPIESTG